MSDLGQALKDSRNEAGLSQTDVADAIHVSRQSISKWENNTQMPDISRVRDLCHLYGVSMDDLMVRMDMAGADAANQTSVLDGRKESANATNEDRLNLVGRTTTTYGKPVYDDSALLLILTAICAFIPIVDLFAPWLILWNNKKSNRYYWWINAICIISFLVALGTYAIAYVMSDKYM